MVETKCFKCNRAIVGDAALGYNLGFGPVYFCAGCAPVFNDSKEITEFLERAMFPKREPDKP